MAVGGSGLGGRTSVMLYSPQHVPSPMRGMRLPGDDQNGRG